MKGAGCGGGESGASGCTLNVYHLILFTQLTLSFLMLQCKFPLKMGEVSMTQIVKFTFNSFANLHLFSGFHI